MPANLPPQYKEAEEGYRQAKSTAEKILALEEMLAIIPHHKGTDKLIAQLRKRLSQHRDESQRPRSVSRQADPFAVKKEGAAQVTLVGLPNSGKSQLLAALTNGRYGSGIRRISRKPRRPALAFSGIIPKRTPSFAYPPAIPSIWRK
jgi:uncharacterized protein